MISEPWVAIDEKYFNKNNFRSLRTGMAGVVVTVQAAIRRKETSGMQNVVLGACE